MYRIGILLFIFLLFASLFATWPVPGYEKVGGSFGTYQTLEQNPADSYNLHPAVDIVAPASTEIVAPENGKIVHIGGYNGASFDSHLLTCPQYEIVINGNSYRFFFST